MDTRLKGGQAGEAGRIEQDAQGGSYLAVFRGSHARLKLQRGVSRKLPDFNRRGSAFDRSIFLGDSFPLW